VVCRDGACHRGAACADGRDGVGCCDVLEDDSQTREALVDVEQRGEELALGVEDADVLGRVRGDLAVDVEDHVDLGTLDYGLQHKQRERAGSPPPWRQRSGRRGRRR
jgi:hypothetical protein